MKKKILSLGGLLALLCASSGYAATGGTVSGTIKGPDGVPFRAAFIRAENVQTKMTMIVLSDPQGKYYTDKLPPGKYEVWATAIGFKSDPLRRPDVAVEDGKDVSLSFTMQKAPVQWSQLNMYQAGTLAPDGPGKGVFLQQCFGCHAFGKIGAVGRRDQDGWKDALNVMRQVKVFDAKPDIENTVTTYLATILGPDSSLPSSPAMLPAYQKIKQERDYFKDDSLNIVYKDYEVAPGIRRRSSVDWQARQGREHLAGDTRRDSQARTRHW